MSITSHKLILVTLTMVSCGIFLISTVSQEVNSSSQNSTKVYYDINSTEEDVKAIRDTGIPFSEFIKEIASDAKAPNATDAQKAGFSDLKENAYLYLYNSYDGCQPENMQLGRIGCDLFASYNTQFCKGYLQVEYDERCSPAVAQEWKKYTDMVNLSDEKLNELAWDRIVAITGMQVFLDE